MSQRSTRRFASWARIRAIASVRVRRVIRTRIAIAAVVLALMPWLLVDSLALLPRLVSLVEFTLVGLTVIAAGAVSEDLDSGEYAVIVTHDASPVDALAGQGAASLALTGLLVSAQLPIALSTAALPAPLALVQCMAWLGALLVAWLAVMLLLATFLEGKANAVAMAALLVLVPLVDGPAVLGRLPGAIATLAHAALQCAPRASHVTAMFRAVLEHRSAGVFPPLVLLLSPVLWFTLAALRLQRLEPAGRLTQ